MAEKKKLGLEEMMARLEEITKTLEDEKLPLDKSLKLYEEGIGLASKCASELDAAKRKIKILQQGENGEIDIVDVPEGTFTEEM